MTMVKFSDVVKRINIKVDRLNTDRLYYTGGEHIDSEELLIHKRGLIAGSTIGYKFHYGFDPGHILFVSRNPHLRKVSMATYAGVCSDSTYVVETKDENVLLQKYLLLEMSSDRFWDWAEENKSGSVNYLINYCTLAEYEFNLPPIEEQRRLADLLWAANDLKEAYRRALKAADEMLKAKFREMFGDPMCSSPKGTTLGKCCILNPAKDKINITDDTTVSFIPMSSISENGKIVDSQIRKYSEVKKGFTYFKENDVLFAKISPCMENGKGAIALNLQNGIGFGSTEYHVLRPIAGKSTSQWLYVLTKYPLFRKEAEKNMTGTAGQRRVPASFLDTFSVNLPDIQQQNLFKDFFETYESSRQKLTTAITDLTTTIKGIINQALEG